MLFIFDWDGTLIDSKAKITHAMQLAAQDMGWEPLEDHLIHNIIGLGLPEAILRLYPAITDQEYVALRNSYAANFIRLDEETPSDLFPTVTQTLDTLRGQGHLLTIATGKSRKGLDRILDCLGMSHYFDATRCADETASKPHPLMLEELLKYFDTKAQDAVMIGDTEYDMDMARCIEMPRIAVSYGAHYIDRLRQYEPELCLDQFDQLLEWRRIK
ncbi:MAG: HAD family hydrolase [Moraxellaceae bacterium]|nr:MAG: HAD family hydrolase [Moraxellaceae bacterium]